MKFFLTSISVIFSYYIYGQVNLVPNPSFEEYDDCPTSFSCILDDTDPYVANWLKPSGGSSDYFNECADLFSSVGIPESYFFSYQPARTGSAYAGFYTYLDGYEYREYVQVQLTEPMEAGNCYYVEFYSSPADVDDGFTIAYATDDVGMYISVDRPTATDMFDYGPMDEFIPQIANPDGVFINDTLEWTKISGIYVADGGEEWITIGNFKEDGDTDIEEFLGDGGYPLCYNVVEDFLVTELDSIDVIKDTVLCAGASLELTVPEGADSYLWSTGETASEITVVTSGIYWVEMNFSCGTFYDTANVFFTIDSIYTSASSETICFNDFPHVLTASEAYDTYVWNTGETSLTLTITEAGVYYVNGYTDCANFIDTFYIDMIEQFDAVDLGNDTLICAEGWQLALQAPPGFDNYNWNTGETTSEIIASDAGTYSVTIETTCETLEDAITITEDPDLNATINIGEDRQLCPPAGINSYVLIATEGLPEYNWSTGETGQSIVVDEEGVYWVRSELLCNTIMDSVIISVCNDIYIPNAFSPNDDGINDVFEIIVADPARIISLVIYDRWGEVIFTGTKLNYAWDGAFNNNQQPMGVYAYMLSYFDGPQQKQLMGNITLIR
ncbi:MAG: gliding motility-associated C-terminal domain-containing protein [Chitinophagales bacterium]|nr:gliding motility-associated C-terminal domain-containing protein [Chitinophagales bacterium]